MKPYAHRRSEKDIIPFEVVRMVSSQTLEIKDMLYDLSKDFKPKIIMGQCLNNDDQHWTITEYPEGLSFRIRYLKDRRWKDVHGNIYTLDDEPIRWHDFGRF